MAIYIFEDVDGKELNRGNFVARITAKRRALNLAIEDHIPVWFYREDKPDKKEKVNPTIWKEWK